MSEHYIERFERIEGILARAAAGQEQNSAAIAAQMSVLKLMMDQQTGMLQQIGKNEGDIQALYAVVNTFADSHKQLLTAQVLMSDELSKLAALTTKIAEAQALHVGEQDEARDKLNALIHMFDEWIKEHGGKRNEGG